MIHIKLFENWLNEDSWHSYVSDGVYEVGEHGIDLCEYQLDLEESIEKYIKDPEYEDEDNLEYDPGKGGIVYITKLKEIGSISLYSVYVLKNGISPISFQQSLTVEGETYYGTYHSVFGSGNTKLVSKGSLESYLKRSKFGL